MTIRDVTFHGVPLEINVIEYHEVDGIRAHIRTPWAQGFVIGIALSMIQIETSKHENGALFHLIEMALKGVLFGAAKTNHALMLVYEGLWGRVWVRDFRKYFDAPTISERRSAGIWDD